MAVLGARSAARGVGVQTDARTVAQDGAGVQGLDGNASEGVDDSGAQAESNTDVEASDVTNVEFEKQLAERDKEIAAFRFRWQKLLFVRAGQAPEPVTMYNKQPIQETYAGFE